MQRSRPPLVHHHHWLTASLSDPAAATSAQSDAAYALFCRLTDVPLGEFALGHMLRWHYFARTEFAARDCPPPAAMTAQP